MSAQITKPVLNYQKAPPMQNDSIPSPQYSSRRSEIRRREITEAMEAWLFIFAVAAGMFIASMASLFISPIYPLVSSTAVLAICLFVRAYLKRQWNKTLAS